MLRKIGKYLLFLLVFALGLLLSSFHFDTLGHDLTIFLIGGLVGAMAVAGDPLLEARSLKELEDAKAKMMARYEATRAKLDKLERWL